jgi:hypothetical protein
MALRREIISDLMISLMAKGSSEAGECCYAAVIPKPVLI